MKKIFFLIIIFLLLIQATTFSQQEDEEREEEISSTTNFKKRFFTIGFLTDYKYMTFDKYYDDLSYHANRPLDLGISLSLLGLKFTISFSILAVGYYETPNNDNFALDFKIDRIGTESYNYIFIKDSSDFITSNGNLSINMNILNIGFTHELLFNKDHSLRSAYVLDRKQNFSNGSLIAGAGIFYSLINLYDLNERHSMLFFGPNLGYSYIWIFNERFFLNILSVFGINLSFLLSEVPSIDDEVSFNIQALPKIAFGYHQDRWSWNIYLHGSYILAYPNTDDRFNLNSGSIGTTFTIRVF